MPILLADQLEEEAGPERVHRRVAQLVDHQQLLTAQRLQQPPERVGHLRGDQAVQQRPCLGEQHTLARHARAQG